MGVNNRQRRAAKKKSRERRQRQSDRRGTWTYDDEPTAADLRDVLGGIVQAIWEDSTAASRGAELLLSGAVADPHTMRVTLQALLAELTAATAKSGWSPGDLAEITRRRATPMHVPIVAGLLAAYAGRFAAASVPPAWSADLAGIGPVEQPSYAAAGEVTQGLEVAAVLSQLPPIAPVLPAPGSADHVRTASGAHAKVLAKVQALLAKAEATEYDEEAEALSAKAQELITRHSLERLLAADRHGSTGDQPGVRRLWIEPPYFAAKAMLVHVVSEANRCRSVMFERLEFCTVIGADDDLDAVELLVLSLLVQAQTAMHRHGRQTDRWGTSRTRSFRQSFLLAYAQRIGERLREADEGVVASSGSELVPVLARHRERVDAACDELFPQLGSKTVRGGDAHGWAAGRAAADRAHLAPEQPWLAAG